MVLLYDIIHLWIFISQSVAEIGWTSFLKFKSGIFKYAGPCRPKFVNPLQDGFIFFIREWLALSPLRPFERFLYAKFRKVLELLTMGSTSTRRRDSTICVRAVGLHLKIARHRF